MEPTWNNTGIAHENGDIEQAHHRFKEALDQALRVRGSRDFADRASYERFVAELVKQRNQTRKARFKEEQPTLGSLPLAPLSPCSELRVRVSRFSTIQVRGPYLFSAFPVAWNTASGPGARLHGSRLMSARGWPSAFLAWWADSKNVSIIVRSSGRS